MAKTGISGKLKGIGLAKIGRHEKSSIEESLNEKSLTRENPESPHYGGPNTTLPNQFIQSYVLYAQHLRPAVRTALSAILT